MGQRGHDSAAPAASPRDLPRVLTGLRRRRPACPQPLQAHARGLALPPFTTFAESVGDYLGTVGIRVRVRSMERAAFLAAWRDKKLQGIIAGSSAALGNTATRLEAFVISTGTYAYGGYPDIDELFRQQAGERDRNKREALLHQMQQLMHERVMHGPIWEPAALHGIGPRVEEPGVGLNPLLYFQLPMRTCV